MGSPAVIPSSNVSGMEKSHLFQCGYIQPVELQCFGAGVVKVTSYISSKQIKCWQVSFCFCSLFSDPFIFTNIRSH